MLEGSATQERIATHRHISDKGWKRVRLDHIDTEEKKLIARLVANFHRRQITREEKIEWINGLARIYQKQGLKVRKPTGETGTPLNEIVEKITAVTGLSVKTVQRYLSDEFKQTSMAREEQKPKVLAEIQKADVPQKPNVEVADEDEKQGLKVRAVKVLTAAQPASAYA